MEIEQGCDEALHDESYSGFYKGNTGDIVVIAGSNPVSKKILLLLNQE